MASREFTDEAGVEWRVWEVGSAHMHPLTRGEDYLDQFADGWLVFESATGKRRLPAPFPIEWAQLDLGSLSALCRRAAPVSMRRERTPSGQARALTEESAERAAREQAERRFTSPRGRAWTVRLHECPRAGGGSSTVLRFTAGDVVVDLPDWPPEWKSLDRDGFALLLLDAEPPRRPGRGSRPQRRREDRPDESAPAEHGTA